MTVYKKHFLLRHQFVAQIDSESQGVGMLLVVMFDFTHEAGRLGDVSVATECVRT